MDNLSNIVLLIDADNSRLSKLESVVREVSTYGRIVVKRAYGNWKKDTLKNWERELKALAIKAEQQFDYVTGKNATDIALVIDAIDLLHKGIYDAFVIVASDSDYTPLAINLHESGVYVMGVGEKKTPESFRNSCDEFIFLENIQDEAQEKEAEEEQQNTENSDEKESPHEKSETLESIHILLKVAYRGLKNDSALIHNYDPVADVLKFPEVMRGYKHRHLPPGDLVQDNAPDGLPGDRVKSVNRLVKQKDLRPRAYGKKKHRLFLHSLGHA